MPEEPEVQPEETEEDISDEDFLAALGIDEDESFEEETEEVEKEYEKEDEKVLARIKQQDEKISKLESERKIEKMESTFDAKAAPEAKEWLSVFRTGKEDPKQLKGLMELAMQKAKEAEKRFSSPEDEDDQARAQKIAQDSWGVGPIKGTKTKDEEEERRHALWEKSKKDVGTLASIILNHETVPEDLKNR